MEDSRELPHNRAHIFHNFPTDSFLFKYVRKQVTKLYKTGKFIILQNNFMQGALSFIITVIEINPFHYSYLPRIQSSPCKCKLENLHAANKSYFLKMYYIISCSVGYYYRAFMAVLVENLEAKRLRQHARQNKVILSALANKGNIPRIQGETRSYSS